MSIFRKKDKVETITERQSVTAEDVGTISHSDVDTETALLQKHVDEDPAAAAAQELERFTLTPGAKNLLDRALDNVAKNKGDALPDADARVVAAMRSDLIEASGNDLGVAVAALVECCEKPTDIPATIYSLCFTVLKAAGFICNLDYRRYLDPRSEFDLGLYTRTGEMDDANSPDRREDEPSAPLGLDTDVDRELALYQALYGETLLDVEDVFARSLSDLRYMLQLTTESFGWDPNQPMPYSVIMEPNGSFTPITDAQTALDHYEVKRKEAQKRRRENEAVRLSSAADKARSIVAAALRR